MGVALYLSTISDRYVSLLSFDASAVGRAQEAAYLRRLIHQESHFSYAASTKHA